MDCINSCVLHSLKSIDSCIPNDFPIPHEEEICWGDLEQTLNLDEIKTSCVSRCGRKPCYEKTYEIKLLPEGEIKCKSLDKMLKGAPDCKENNISLTISFNQFSISKITSVPRIQSLEIASNIGGYLGLWIGFSFLQFADLIVSISLASFYTIIHFIKKIKSTIQPFESSDEQRSEEIFSETCDTSTAVRIFKKSFISSVADVATSRSTKEKWIKLMIFLMNLCGFLYFAFDFTRQYLAYETVSIQSIDKPMTIDRPAITLCDANRRNRRSVCREQPHKCVFFNSDEELCNKHKRYCNLNDMYYGVFKGDPICQDDCYTWNRTKLEFKNYIMGIKDFNFQDFPEDKKYYYPFFTNNEGEPAYCISYGLNSRFPSKGLPKSDNMNDTIWRNQTFRTWKDIIIHAMIFLDEYLDPYAIPSLYVAIHDSTRLVNPFRYGEKLRVPGYHLIQVTDYIEQNLLPHPYETNCTLHSLEGNTDENFDLMDCTERCNLNLHVEQYGCAPRSISISHTVKLCKKGVKVKKQNHDVCLKRCSTMPCVSRMYKYKHSQRLLRGSDGDGDSYYGYMKDFPGYYNTSRMVFIFLSFRDMKARITMFAPKMMSIDLFSNIGGFLGIWIGSSVLSVSDLLYRLSDYLLDRIKK